MTRRGGGRTSGLTRHQYLMLLALLGGDSHGLGIAREVERLSDGQVRLWPAMLYGSLQEMAVRGWIEELHRERPPDESEKKRFYRVTAAGRKVARMETLRLGALLKTARARIRGNET